MSNDFEESPGIPSYEEFKQRLTAALNNSETNWSRKIKNELAGNQENNHYCKDLCPHISRIYQRRLAHRRTRQFAPYSDENIRKR